MKINSNINIIGGLADFNLIKHFLLEEKGSITQHIEFTDIRTEKAVKRFKKAIIESFGTDNENLKLLFLEFVKNQSVDNLNYLLFLMFSYNNDLFKYLNDNVYFPIYFSGRKSIKKEEVLLCMRDLQKKNQKLKQWSESTLNTTASKYLTLLKKLGAATGVNKKEIVYKNATFNDFILFNYFLTEVDLNSNKFHSSWLPYSFFETEFFIRQILDKRLIPFLEINFIGDNLKMKTLINYKDLYHALKST